MTARGSLGLGGCRPGSNASHWDRLSQPSPNSHPLQARNPQQPQAELEGVGAEVAEGLARAAGGTADLEHGHLVVEAVEHLAEFEQVAAQPVGQQQILHLGDHRIELEQLTPQGPLLGFAELELGLMDLACFSGSASALSDGARNHRGHNGPLVLIGGTMP